MHAKMAATLVRALVFFIVLSMYWHLRIDTMLLMEILHVIPTAGLQSLRFHTVLCSTIDLKGVWFDGILEAWFI